MIIAHENDHLSPVLHATRAIVFMGTPHRGSAIAAAVKPIAALMNVWLDVSMTSALIGSMRSDLIDLLKRDSDKLDDINDAFRQRARNIIILSFYETLNYPRLSQLVRS